MKTPPYTLIEATELSAEYQFIKGSRYDSSADDATVVEQLVITPFDEISKNKFMLYLHLLNDAEAILNEVYAGSEFDILVIARSSKDEKEILHKNLFTWLNNNFPPKSEKNIVADAIKSSIKGLTKESFNLN
jgi:hypothetical protein